MIIAIVYKRVSKVTKIIMFFYVLFLYGCTYLIDIEKKPLKRVALVIGNQHYIGNELKNPINDAKGMAKTLKGIGFEVLLELDITLHQLNQALKKLETMVEADNSMVFIYFAGHGNTLTKGSAEQYLLMTNQEEKVLVSIYKFYDFLSRVKARYNIMVIDACRDYQEHYIPMEKSVNQEALNNYRGNFREVMIRYEDGLKVDENVILDNKYSYLFPTSTILSYSTDLYQKAKDWSIYSSEHSPYSYALINYLNDEEIPIEEVFKRVRSSLITETENKQSNLEKTSLQKNIWLVPKRADVAVAPPI
jgi:uncharacterized caspase-like protein